MRRLKEWIYRHRIGLIITGLVMTAAGITAVIVIKSRKVTVPLQVLAEVVPEIPVAAEKVAEKVTVNVDGIVKTFPRESFIRHLHEGWKASAEKIAQAAKLGIDLNEGETLVNSCLVHCKAAA